MLGSPNETAYDLRFRMLQIPVRVHPLFWVIMLILSGQIDQKNAAGAVIFVACAFVSVLVHELGHGLSSRASGSEPLGIVLYAMGGYCQVQIDRLRAWQKVLVLLAGPGAGFLLLALTLAFFHARYGVEPVGILTASLGIGRPGVGTVLALGRLDPRVFETFIYLVEINLWWGLLNLLPIWPLDGGRVAEVLLGQVNGRHGTRWAHVVSLLAAAGIALYWFSLGQTWMGIWFAYFGLVNYQMLQAHYNAFHANQDRWWDQ